MTDLDERTIVEVLLAAASSHGGAVAIMEPTGEGLTYLQLRDRAVALGARLVAEGVEVGDNVALWGQNSTAWAVAQAAILMVGARAVPINTRYTVFEAGHLVEATDARVVFAADRFLGRSYCEEAALAWPTRTILGLGEGVGVPPDWELELDRDTGLEVVERAVAVGPDDFCHVQFTSGTTGKPKGVLLRHGPSVRTSRLWVGATGLREGDRYPGVAPFSHLGGHKTGLLACAIARATLIPVPVLEREGLSRLVSERSVTFMQGPPTMFYELVEQARIDPEPTRHVRVAVTGAAVVPPSLIRDLYAVVEVEQVHTAYGLTEATGVCSMTSADDDVSTIANTVGKPLPGVEVRIVGPDGAVLPLGDAGEVVLRGDNVMGCYLDDPEATAEVIRAGWLYTGDVGTFDEHRNLSIVDRLTDMVLVGGLNVYPAEVEHLLLEHPAVSAVAVVGVPDERLGEVPVAFVVPAGEVTADELRDWCRERLAGFKVPRRFTFLDQFPLNPVGKVAKRALRDRARVTGLSA